MKPAPYRIQSKERKMKTNKLLITIRPIDITQEAFYPAGNHSCRIRTGGVSRNLVA